MVSNDASKFSVDGTVYSARRNIRPLSTPAAEAYIPIVGIETITKLREVSKQLRGLKFLSINASAEGGGVAELLHSAVPFMDMLGIETEWKIIPRDQEFFECTKSLHNILQGKNVPFTQEMEQCYISYIQETTKGDIIDYNPELVLVHDPQPLGLAEYLKKPGQKWLWRCHIDIEDMPLQNTPGLWDFLTNRIEYYDAAIFSAVHYTVSRWHVPSFVIPPFIDPLSEKNRELSEGEINETLAKYHINPEIPLIVQIGRFDPWKGIDRSIATYREVRKHRECQLIIAGGHAVDDPEGEVVLTDIRRKTEDDENIHVLNLSLSNRLENWREVNALQRAASVIMQPSTREGFGLTVTEALWKGKPVIAANAGAIPLQIRDGSTGYFYQTSYEAAQTVLNLLENPYIAEEVGGKAREYVREHFLLPVRMIDWLRAMSMVMNGQVNREIFSQSIICFHPWFKLAKRKLI